MQQRCLVSLKDAAGLPGGVSRSVLLARCLSREILRPSRWDNIRRRPAEADSSRGVTRSRLAADSRSPVGLDRISLCCNSCVATNLTIRRINRRDSAVVEVVRGEAPDVTVHRDLAHNFTQLNGYWFGYNKLRRCTGPGKDSQAT